MLTPVDVQNKAFKGGIGFDKKDVEAFMAELSSDYSELYRSNVELKDKVATLDESLQHYRTIEESVQKSLTISEKAAEETINAAQDKARQINIEAEKKAEAMLADAKEELEQTQAEIFRLKQQHATFVAQFKKVLNAQLQLCDGEVIDIDLGDAFDTSRYSDSGYSGLGSEGGLGGGGGYTGSSSYDDGRERAAGEPSASVGSLNIDPFADAKNGGGRFSTKTTQKSSSGKTSDGSKLSLNIKSDQPNNVKVKRNFNKAATPDSQETAKQPQKAKPAPKKTEAAAAPAKENRKQSAKEEKQKQNMEAQRAREEAKNLEAERLAREAAARAEQERKAAEEATARAKAKAEEDARNEEMAKAHIDKELESTINAVREAAKHQNEPEQNPYVNNTQSFYSAPKKEEPKVSPEPAAPQYEEHLSGEVEDKVNESTMLDSEDNYSTGFDFVSDTEDTYGYGDTSSEEAVVGEVESRVDESTMIDSEDNYSTGFDFVSDSEDVDSTGLTFEEDDSDSAYVGEVEERVNEATMIDSEDNYSDGGFDFLVEEEPSEEIPTINQGLNANLNFSIHTQEAAAGSEEPATGGLNANLNFGNETEDDVFVGDVEEKVNQSNLIGNDDDEDEGFNFL